MKEDGFQYKQKRFINELYKNKRYFDCIAETQRLLNYESKIPGKDEFLYFIEACYYLGGQYSTVISRLKAGDNLRPEKIAYLFLLSNSYFNLGKDKLSAGVLYKTDYPEIDNDRRSGLFTNRAGILAGNFEYEKILSEIETAGNYIDSFNRSFALADFKKDIEYYREIGLRSRWLSVSMSALLPGAGQAYSGRIIDGIISFAAVAGTAYGAYYFYRKDERPLGITLAFFSGLFYCGNLYGAYNSAMQANKELKQKFTDGIISKYNLEYDPMDYMRPGILE